MRKHYDFSRTRRFPHAKRRKKQVTIRLEEGNLATGKSSDRSFADLTADHCGIWHDGPQDLSTGPNHLRDYGR
jgi:hypothetical protein